MIWLFIDRRAVSVFVIGEEIRRVTVTVKVLIQFCKFAESVVASGSVAQETVIFIVDTNVNRKSDDIIFYVGIVVFNLADKFLSAAKVLRHFRTVSVFVILVDCRSADNVCSSRRLFVSQRFFLFRQCVRDRTEFRPAFCKKCVVRAVRAI